METKPLSSNNKKIARRKLILDFLRFTVAGASSTLAQFGILIFLVENFHINPTLASAIGFLFGCVVNYIILYYWAFNSNGKHSVLIVRYTLVMTITLILNIVVFWTMTEVLIIWYPVSQFVAVCFVAIANFILNRFYTFT